MCIMTIFGYRTLDITAGAENRDRKVKQEHVFVRGWDGVGITLPLTL